MSAPTALAPPPDLVVDVRRPVLVCGVGRSGTTLVQSMLAAHPELCLPPETHFFGRYVAPDRLRRRLEASGPGALRSVLAADRELARAEIGLDELLEPFVAADRPLDLARVYARLLELYARRAGKPRVGDKDPHHLDDLAALAAAFPDARVLHVVRDPRDVVLSRTKAAWSADRPWWLHALIAQEQLRRGRRAGRAAFGSAYREVRYEELLREPEATLRAICDHVDVAFDPAMLAFGRAADRLIDPGELAWKREALGPLLARNAGKWRSELSAGRAAWIAALCPEGLNGDGGPGDRGKPSERGGPARRLVGGATRWVAPAAYRCARALRQGRRADRVVCAPAPRATHAGDGPPAHRLGRRRALRVDGDTLWASAGLDLWRSSDAGGTFVRVARASAARLPRVLASTPLVERLLRAGFHDLVPGADGGLVAVVRGALLHLRPGAETFGLAHRVRRGSRPLAVCASGSGRLFFGEYFQNGAREPVHVYGSDDGRHFEVVHTFPAGSIRHVHGIVPDAGRGGLWVLTGDEGDEAGLWWTDDEFRTLEPVVRGVQGARAVSVLPHPDGLIVPTDTPHEPNFVQLLDPATGRLERLASLPGSVFFTGRTRSLYLLSTTVEASRVNRDPRAALYASRDGLDWRPVARLERDLAFLRDRRGYLTYPTLRLPRSSGAPEHVFATARALRGLHGQLLRWHEDDVLRFIEEAGR